MKKTDTPHPGHGEGEFRTMQMQSYLLAAFALLTIAALFKSKTLSKFLGGRCIRRTALRHLDRSVYHQFHNLSISAWEGAPQIGHVIASKFGIFVIETLHMHGRISGKEYEPSWQRRLGSHDHAFQNPLRNNYKNIKALDTLLEIGEHKIFSVATFEGNCEFESEFPENVIKNNEVVEYVTSKTKVLISDARLAEILDVLKSVAAVRPAVAENAQPD